jgi:hypothetical protein
LWKLIAANDTSYNAITHALRDLASPHSRRNLLRALRGEFPGDSNKDLAGVALQILVPKINSVASILPFIEVSRMKGYRGSYDTALDWHLPNALTDADLPLLLKRMGNWAGCFDALSPLRNLAERGFALALEHLDNPIIRKRTVEMCLKKLRVYERFPERDDAMDTSGLKNTSLRHRLLEALLNSGLVTQTDIFLLNPPLVNPEDFSWLLSEAQRAPAKYRDRWGQLAARYVWGPERKVHKELLLATYTNVPEFAKYLPTTKKGDINTTLDRCERAGELRAARIKRKWESQTQSRPQLLTHSLKAASDGHTASWVGIHNMRLLFSRTKKRQNDGATFHAPTSGQHRDGRKHLSPGGTRWSRPLGCF